MMMAGQPRVKPKQLRHFPPRVQDAGASIAAAEIEPVIAVRRTMRPGSGGGNSDPLAVTVSEVLGTFVCLTR